MNHRITGIVQTVIPQSPTLQTVFQLGFVMTYKMKERFHLQIALQQLRLLDVPRNSIQNKMVDLRLKFSQGDQMSHMLTP